MRNGIMQIHRTDFSKGNVYKNILEVAAPMTLAQILNLLYNIVDRMYIGRIPNAGSTALTGVGICFPIITMIAAFTVLFGNGGSPLCAMELGKSNYKEAEEIMGNTFSLLLITSVVLMIVGYVFYRPILYAFGASDITYSYAREYVLIYLAGTPAVMIVLGLNPFINGQGFGSMGMLTTLIGTVINVILDPVFIFVFHLGVSGAAIATVISQAVSAVWVLAFLTGKRALLHLTKPAMILQAGRVKRIVSLGISSFMMQFTNGLVQIVCNSTLQSYGGDIYVGVMTVLNSVREIAQMPVFGLTNGASPVMSFNYGEGTYDRVKKAIVFVAVSSVTYTLLIWGVLRLVPELFIKIFNDDPELLVKGTSALHIYFFGFCFMALQYTGQTVFVALGKARKATFFSAFRKIMIVIPLTLLLPMVGNLGVDGVFWAEPISNLIGGCACFVTMVVTILMREPMKNSGK